MAHPRDGAAVPSRTPLGLPSSALKPYSCVVCHKRKVKCNREEPCSNCAKASVECIYRPPAPPRRRKRERDGSRGASQEREKSVRRNSREPSSGGNAAHHASPARNMSNGTETSRSGSGRMIMREGNSVYLDKLLPDAAEVLGDAADDNSDNASQDEDNVSSMLLSHGTREGLAELHPNPLHIFKLWQTFLERVNPLTKIVHAPTVQQQILEAMSDLKQVSKDFEALMFSIYCISLISLQAGDVEKAFGESKKKLLSRCRRGAQQAFRNASFLRTSSTVVLQAFILYLLSMRAFSDPHTIWSLSGVALRMAQRIGIHRDGSGHGLSIFETEMRRRIWFQLMILDATSAQFCGVAAGPFVDSADTRPPMNANDSDLDPRMTEPACEKEGPSEMIFCLARSEFGKWLRRWNTNTGGSGSPWAFLSSSTLSLSEKDRCIDELEDIMEQKFLKYCDQSIPLHLATTMMVRSSSHYTRLMAHHPRHYHDSGARIPQSEKDVIFGHCLKMAEYADYAQTNPDVQRFSWHMVNHMPWDAMIFMLSEMRNRTDPDEKDKVWEIVGSIYGRHVRQMGKKSQMPLHKALQNLFVKAWRAYVDECNQHGRTPRPCPTVVSSSFNTSKGFTEAQVAHENAQMEVNNAPVQEPGQYASNVPFDGGTENMDFLLGDSPMDWSEWDNLLNQFQESLVDDMTLMPGSV
ncbi:uncharacterized protein N7496_005071 [Penicillium cataractarum]|uniref:Zn(2)-C6 fungal-type domain-containing protein n=1 Tax=Penicillium cataractarum TaxID=2100454 RepID=A0A9W9SFH1_9EURO|nr:uncharacterized protein N7496_005071 [Penicillium cataractarum]KAJ5377662.1 hypothetical protein N7496_005071 [Penicillium cataractarum]